MQEKSIPNRGKHRWQVAQSVRGTVRRLVFRAESKKSIRAYRASWTTVKTGFYSE